MRATALPRRAREADAQNVTTAAQTSLDRFFVAHTVPPCAPHSAAERRALVDCLEDPGRWPEMCQAAENLLGEIGL
jgi:hypothetical protein